MPALILGGVIQCVLVAQLYLFVTPWTVALQAPLSMEFSKQEFWSGLPFPSPEDLLDPGIEPESPALQADFVFNLKKLFFLIKR